MGVVPNPDGMMTLAHSSVYIFWRYCCFQGAISTTRLAYLLALSIIGKQSIYLFLGLSESEDIHRRMKVLCSEGRIPGTIQVGLF